MRDHLNHKMYIIGSWQDPLPFVRLQQQLPAKWWFSQKVIKFKICSYGDCIIHIYPKGQIWRPWLALPWQLRPQQPSLFAAGGGGGRPCWGWGWGWWWAWWWWCCWRVMVIVMVTIMVMMMMVVDEWSLPSHFNSLNFDAPRVGCLVKSWLKEKQLKYNVKRHHLELLGLKLFDKKIRKSERCIQLDQQLSFANRHTCKRKIKRIANAVDSFPVFDC